MNEQLFMWIIGGLVLIFGAGFSGLYLILNSHMNDDENKHSDHNKAIEEAKKEAHNIEIRALQTFATKTDLAGITQHIDQGLNGVNSRLDLVLLNMSPGKQ